MEKDLAVMERRFRKTDTASGSSNLSFFIVEVVGMSDY
jgi:hypothetical protein